MTLEQRYANLLRRRASVEDRRTRSFSEQYEREGELSLRLLVGSMAPVERAYTQRLVEQGDRIQSQLADRFPPVRTGVVFRRQGSVSNNTHIRFSSDVDLLVITGDFETLESPQVPANPYTGIPSDDLRLLRAQAVAHLRNAFPAVTVDDTGSTAVWLRGGSLSCDVDVVPSNWYNTNGYASSGMERDRGVMVLNRDTNARITNYPFLFNYRIEQRDAEFQGMLRAQIRLLKTIKADLEQEGKSVELSSFDVCSIVYRMSSDGFSKIRLSPYQIATRLMQWLRFIESDRSIRESLYVVDDSRKIFDDHKKFDGLVRLLGGLQELYSALPNSLSAYLYETQAHL